MDVFYQILKSVAYERNRPNQLEKTAIISYFNAFIDKNNLPDEDEIFYYVCWKTGDINKILLDILIKDLGLHLSSCIRQILKLNNNSCDRIRYCLNTYKKHINKLELSELFLDVNNNYSLSAEEKKNILDVFKESNLVYDSILESVKKYKKTFFSSPHQEINELCEKYNLARRTSKNKSYAYIEDYIFCRQIMDKLRKKQLIQLKNTIQITGSNGKGSTATILETLLLTLGYRVNKFINPSVIDNDMIRINGKVIPQTILEQCTQVVLDTYEEILKNNEFNINFEYIKNYFDKNSLYYMKQGNESGKIILNAWYLKSPIIYLAFSNNDADFNITEVVTNGAKDSTNVLTDDEVCATVLTNIQYGIGSNDTTAKIYNDKGEVEYSNRAKARHKSLLGKKNTSIVVANQPQDSLNEIRRVAKDVLETETFEYGRDWFLNDLDENTFSITVFGKEHIFNKSKILFDKYQTINFATALATLYKLENEGKIKKLDDKLLQKGIDNAKSPARPQRALKGNYRIFFGKAVDDIIYGVIKLNKSGVETFEDIIRDSKIEFNNYFIYTSNNESALKSHEMYFFDFIKDLQNNNNNCLVLYKKNPEIYKKIVDILNEKQIKYVEKNMLSQAITYTKNLIKQNNNSNKNRVFITCDSMVGFDKNIVYLNDGIDV